LVQLDQKLRVVNEEINTVVTMLLLRYFSTEERAIYPLALSHVFVPYQLGIRGGTLLRFIGDIGSENSLIKEANSSAQYGNM
jgi:hypothetical protein